MASPATRSDPASADPNPGLALANIPTPGDYAEAIAILQQMANLTRSAGSKPQPLTPIDRNGEQEDSPHRGPAQRWKAELRYRALVERIPAVTFMAALDDTVHELYVSPQIEALLGFSQKEWVENPFLWYSQLHPEDRARWGSEFARTCATGVQFKSEYRLMTRDNRVVWVHGECQVIQDEDGRPVFLQGIAFDITESKRAEETLRQAHNELESRVKQRTAELAQANELLRAENAQRKSVETELRVAKEAAEAASQAKDQFLAVLSHELRTPLTPVLASVEHLARQPNLPDEIAAALDMIRRNVAMEANIIDDLLDLTRISRGKIELRPKTIDAHTVLRHALEVWQRQIEAKRLAVSLSLWADQHYVRADPTRLQQVFWNLIGNATKFTPEGGRITLRSTNDAAGRLIVEVEDTGIGIAKDLLPRLFTAFEQGERTVTRRYGGLGLGLAISKALVEMHHGTLVATSQGAGHGATFTVSLVPTSAPAAERPAIVPAAQGNGPTLRILLVDDHEDTARVMSRLLRNAGFEVTTAGSVGEALRTADAAEFDLLLSDLGLPDGSGHDLLRGLKTRRPIRAIALSGFGMDEDVQRSREAGFDRHLTKPASLDVLEATIRELFA